jgi:hypothetical protein
LPADQRKINFGMKALNHFACLEVPNTFEAGGRGDSQLLCERLHGGASVCLEKTDQSLIDEVKRAIHIRKIALVPNYLRFGCFLAGVSSAYGS